MKFHSPALIAALAMACSPLAAEETVREVGDSFICHYQNAGDNTYAGGPIAYAASTKDWTDDEIASMERALLTWEDLIGNTPGRKLSVGLFWTTDSSDVLGSAGSPFSFTDAPGNKYLTSNFAESVWRNGSTTSIDKMYDIQIVFNSAADFYFGEAVTDIGYLYDFQSVVTHEIGHALGFYSMTSADGDSVYFDLDAGGDTILYTAYDGLLRNAHGASVVDLAADSLTQTNTEPTAFRTGDTITLGGTALDGQADLAIYNPATWEGGSSVSHIARSSEQDALMQPSIGNNIFRRELSERERQAMGAMGWSLAALPEALAVAIPEPATAALALLALAALMARRRRR